MSDKPNDGGPARFTLVTGQVATIDSGDAGVVMSHRWRLGANGYVYRVGGRKQGAVCLLHRLITNASTGSEVHHRNGDKLDNRRANLEVTSPSAHQKEHHSLATSERNRARRLYPAVIACAGCGAEVMVNPSHRGRNRFCTRSCGNKNRRASHAK